MNPSCDLIAPARALVRAGLSDASREHCERTAAAARALALRHGVDADDAELAGLLHDLARDMSDEDLVRAAAEHGLAVGHAETAAPYLLHGPVAAAMASTEIPGISRAVLDAIAAHTYGAVPMSDLSRVVYLADMIEPARRFDGADELRSSCEHDELAECFRRGYARSVRHVREAGRVLHPVSHGVAAAIERETGRPLFDTAEVAP